jgi:hypothetical protein
MLSFEESLRIVKQGRKYVPASKHHDHCKHAEDSNIVVVCDRCNRTNILVSYGFDDEEEDLCSECYEIISDAIKNNTLEEMRKNDETNLMGNINKRTRYDNEPLTLMEVSNNNPVDDVKKNLQENCKRLMTRMAVSSNFPRGEPLTLMQVNYNNPSAETERRQRDMPVLTLMQVSYNNPIKEDQKPLLKMRVSANNPKEKPLTKMAVDMNCCGKS